MHAKIKKSAPGKLSFLTPTFSIYQQDNMENNRPNKEATYHSLIKTNVNH